MKRMLAAVLLVVTLSIAAAAPASAQTGFDPDEIQNVQFLFANPFSGDVYAMLTTTQTNLTMQGYHEACEYVGFERALGGQRYREGGVRYIDVICIGSDEVVPV